MVQDSTWRFIGTLAGIFFVAMSVLASFLYPQPPQIDSSPAVVLRWAQVHRAGIEAGMVLGVFGALAFLVFGLRVRHWLDESGRDPLGTLIIAATSAFVAVYALGAIPLAELALTEGQRGPLANPDVVRLLIDLNQILFSPAIGLAGVVLLSVGIAMRATNTAPIWLAWSAILVALLDLLEIAPALTFGTYHGVGWALLGWCSFLGFLVIVLLLSVAQARSATPQPSQVIQAVPA